MSIEFVDGLGMLLHQAAPVVPQGGELLSLRCVEHIKRGAAVGGGGGLGAGAGAGAGAVAAGAQASSLGQRDSAADKVVMYSHSLGSQQQQPLQSQQHSTSTIIASTHMSGGGPDAAGLGSISIHEMFRFRAGQRVRVYASSPPAAAQAHNHCMQLRLLEATPPAARLL